MVEAGVGPYAAAASLILLLSHHCWRLIRPKIRHPPSPSSFPFVGNLFSIPSGPEHLAFSKLGEQLESDIIFLEMFGHKLLILNSAESVSELLDKRSALYSDRPPIPMVTGPA
ncbi:hypothetical protein FRC11_012477, partial [Ceratobasidium sp. 423]